MATEANREPKPTTAPQFCTWCRKEHTGQFATCDSCWEVIKTPQPTAIDHRWPTR